MKVSEITVTHLINYLRLGDASAEDSALLEVFLGVAKAYIFSYTGLGPNALDLHNEISIAVFVLVQDMFDNRVNYVDKANPNRTVETILGLHRVNLL